MKTWLFPIVGLGFIALALTGYTLDEMSSGLATLYVAVGLTVFVGVAARLTYYRSGTAWPNSDGDPKPMRLKWTDYLKALVSWLNAFKHTYAVEPGLYYTGEVYDSDTPLLVTSNYGLTVFLVVRQIGTRNVRLLVVDTDGINVWCAAGKGAFSNAAILAQVNRYPRGLLTDTKWLKMVLPKFGFAGVDLRSLRNEKIRPLIGPLYAKDLPAYLAKTPLEDRETDRAVFGLQSRLFSWLPGLVQYMSYSFAIILIFLFVQLFWGRPAPWGLVTITAILATAYPVLFPWLPGQRFSVKGLWLAGGFSLCIAALQLMGVVSTASMVMGVVFSFATALFFSLSYTGNSAVSNYTKVRAEVARFLPVNLLLYVAALVAFITMGAYQ